MSSLTTRLAPSPTGALHLGNVRTFLINYALAKQENWRIVLRIEDLDSPRVTPQTVALTIDLLTWLGLTWEGEPLLQSTCREAHVAAMQALAERGFVYPSETYKPVLGSAENAQSAPNEGSRELRYGPEHRPSDMPRTFVDAWRAWRYATPSDSLEFTDLFAGTTRSQPSATVGDFVVWSRHQGTTLGQAAYQLAVVVDDAAAGVTHVVRGNDLLDSAGRQMLLQRALGLPTPVYCHVPLVRGDDGKRLAKRHGDTRLDMYRAKGVRQERVIGLMASWCGLRSREDREEMKLTEFINGFSLATLPKDDVVYNRADERWLLGTS